MRNTLKLKSLQKYIDHVDLEKFYNNSFSIFPEIYQYQVIIYVALKKPKNVRTHTCQ